MAGKSSKNNKQIEAERGTARKQRAAQILFAIFAIILILSMVLSAVTSY